MGLSRPVLLSQVLVWQTASTNAQRAMNDFQAAFEELIQQASPHTDRAAFVDKMMVRARPLACR